jgi:hypothetical protein
MDIKLETRDDALDVQRLFGDRGWRLTPAGPGRFLASHHEAGDQHAARAKLDQLGLLTSNRLHIELGPFGPVAATLRLR